MVPKRTKYTRLVWDKITFQWMPAEERLARIIARHMIRGSDTGEQFGRYILLARSILDEVYIIVPGPKEDDA